jgi:hypothetical protein
MGAINDALTRIRIAACACQLEHTVPYLGEICQWIG